MAGITITYDIAMAAGKDAANRSMRKAGRTAWNKADYNKSWEVFNTLWTIEDELRYGNGR